MEKAFNPTNIAETLAAKEFPTIVMWNRLECRPRTHNFNKALKAEIRDALWMLTRQWQMGEFKADDAGSPVFAKFFISSSALSDYKADGNSTQPFESNIPLETKVEQRKIPFYREDRRLNIDIRLQMGRYWLKLVKKENFSFNDNYIQKYIELYGFVLPEKQSETDYIYAHKDVWQRYAAISGRCMDGYKLYEYLSMPGKHASDDVENTDPEKTQLDSLGDKFKLWFEKMYYQPADEKNNAWLPDRLEYQFDCIANTKRESKTLLANQYYQGNLDWYNFNIKQEAIAGTGAEKNTFKSSLIPAHVKFEGMPETRWWKFEDSKTNLGNIQPATTDLSKLILMEFGLVFSNDWFVTPFTLPVGSLANIEGLTVRNNFGETIWIKAAEDSKNETGKWSMFKLSSQAQNNTLFLAPSAMKVHEGQPLEKIVFIRDEMSNMVWGIETIVPSINSYGEKGSEVALRVRQYHEKIVSLIDRTQREAQFHLDYLDSLSFLNTSLMGAKADLEALVTELNTDAPDIFNLTEELKQIRNVLESEAALLEFTEEKKPSVYKANISYLAMTEVPENWIPFVPVHVKNNTPGDSREIQLQRASMLRTLGDNADPVKIKPQTSVLREGLDKLPKPLPYYIHEEEVLRSGIEVSQSFQRTRWINGEVFVWLGMKKKTGRGEGSSGLAFDQIKNV